MFGSVRCYQWSIKDGTLVLGASPYLSVSVRPYVVVDHKGVKLVENVAPFLDLERQSGSSVVVAAILPVPAVEGLTGRTPARTAHVAALWTTAGADDLAAQVRRLARCLGLDPNPPSHSSGGSSGGGTAYVTAGGVDGRVAYQDESSHPNPYGPGGYREDVGADHATVPGAGHPGVRPGLYDVREADGVAQGPVATSRMLGDKGQR